MRAWASTEAGPEMSDRMRAHASAAANVWVTSGISAGMHTWMRAGVCTWMGANVCTKMGAEADGEMHAKVISWVCSIALNG